MVVVTYRLLATWVLWTWKDRWRVGTVAGKGEKNNSLNIHLPFIYVFIATTGRGILCSDKGENAARVHGDGERQQRAVFAALIPIPIAIFHYSITWSFECQFQFGRWAETWPKSELIHGTVYKNNKCFTCNQSTSVAILPISCVFFI